jgi:hypothetical protein
MATAAHCAHPPLNDFHPTGKSERFTSEHRVLDILEALHTPLHLLRRFIIPSLRMLMDFQLVFISTHMLALHNVLAQDVCYALGMLERLAGFLRAGLEFAGSVEGVTGELARRGECGGVAWYIILK